MCDNGSQLRPGPVGDGSSVTIRLRCGRTGTARPWPTLPAEYRGLRDPQSQARWAQDYCGRQMDRDHVAGGDYTDQSTPIRAWLSRNSAIVRKDARHLWQCRLYGTSVDPGGWQERLQDADHWDDWSHSG